MLGDFLQYGLIVQAIALTHFVRRRPDGFWIFVTLSRIRGVYPGLKSVI